MRYIEHIHKIGTKLGSQQDTVPVLVKGIQTRKHPLST